MPRSTIEAWSSGSSTPCSMPRTSSARGRRKGAWSVVRIKPVGALKICPIRRYRQGDGPARRLEGARRRDPFLDVPGAGRLDLAADRDRARRPPRPPRQHRAPAPRAPARGRSGRRRAGAPRHRRPSAARLFARARGAGPGLRPAELHAARRAARECSPNGSAPTPRTPPPRVTHGASRPAAVPVRDRA